MAKRPPKHTWIIGASSGIGEALARELARRGEVVCVSARRAEVVETLARNLGPQHLAIAADVADFDGLRRAALRLAAKWGRIDRVIVMAAIYEPMKMAELNLIETRRIIDVNLMGMFNAVSVALEVLKPQGSGQLALCASVAGYRGLPNAQPYAATKAGVISLATSLRLEEGGWLDVKAINPGFVETPMTGKNTFDMPFIITPDKAAKEIARGLKGRQFEIHFPKNFTRIMKLMALLPDGLYFKLASKVK